MNESMGGFYPPDYLALTIELQIYTDTDWIMRSLLYLGRIFDSIGFGDAYILLKPTTLVCIMGYTLFPNTAEFYACYELRNSKICNVNATSVND